MLTKAFDQIIAADIEGLCERGVYESQTLEFKQDLPGDGGRADAWNAGGKISPTARDGLLREIVAFANAQGGTLILGIAETKEKPPRAESITAVSRIHELADRLQEAARACIEPPLGALQVRGIVTSGEREGVVIFRTSASLAGPHRVAGDGHAFIRRGPSSVQMTMREIQDLTLDVARGAERLESIFAHRTSSFTQWVQTSATEVGAFRITGVPLGSFPGVPDIIAQGRTPRVRGRSRHLVLIDGASVDCAAPPHGGVRPIVRGFRLHAQDDATRIDVYQSGLVDMWSRHAPVGGKHFYIGWLLGSYLLVLDLIESLRTVASSPDFEFALEFALAGHTVTPRFGGEQYPFQGWFLAPPTIRTTPGKSKSFPQRSPGFRLEVRPITRMS